MTSVTLYSHDSNAKLLLVYFYDLLSKQSSSPVPSQAFYLNHFLNYTKDIMSLDQLSSDSFIILGLGCGKFEIVGDKDGEVYNVQVKHIPQNTVTFIKKSYYSECQIIFEVTVEYKHKYQTVEKLLEKAKDFFMEYLSRSAVCDSLYPIKKYIYIPENNGWNLMDFSCDRKMDSLFLPKDEKEKLVDFVNDFFDENTKADYMKYNIPYKCNVLLYGVPGAGKTSTILALASKLKMNIGMIPITSKLNDTKLITALNDLKTCKCKIIVLEDIDCLFTERKSCDVQKNSVTLSGLLNCLDGLFRNQGIIVFATANNIDFVDEAFLRSGRIDYKLYFGYATEYQIRQCLEFYFGENISITDKFVQAVKGKQFSISTLQSFLFKYRKARNILDHLDEFHKILCIESETSGKSCTFNKNGLGLYS